MAQSPTLLILDSNASSASHTNLGADNKQKDESRQQPLLMFEDDFVPPSSSSSSSFPGSGAFAHGDIASVHKSIAGEDETTKREEVIGSSLKKEGQQTGKSA